LRFCSYVASGRWLLPLGYGASPTPVEQPTTFGFVVNFRTAKSLGLQCPSVLLQANSIIE
jgi:hypothetical protein